MIIAYIFIWGKRWPTYDVFNKNNQMNFERSPYLSIFSKQGDIKQVYPFMVPVVKFKLLHINVKASVNLSSLKWRHWSHSGWSSLIERAALVPLSGIQKFENITCLHTVRQFEHVRVGNIPISPHQVPTFISKLQQSNKAIQQRWNIWKCTLKLIGTIQWVLYWENSYVPYGSYFIAYLVWVLKIAGSLSR